jgi:hypothetical protein
MRCVLGIGILIVLTIVSVWLLRAFDKIAGRGPKQVADGNKGTFVRNVPRDFGILF